MQLTTLDQIRTARAQLPSDVLHTPLLCAAQLGAAPVWLKAESLQTTGSYKLRAAFTVLRNLSPEERRHGAAISSSGNFAGAWAYAGRALGIPVAVVMQEKTSPYKVERTRTYGAEVVLCENHFEARFETLAALERDRGMRAINTFEHPDVIAGHGTIGIEILEDLPEVDNILVPMSSGGLIAGIATAVKQSRPGVRVYGVQPTGSHAVHTSRQRGEVTRIDRVETICDALVAQFPGSLPFAHIRRYVDDTVLVSDTEVKQAIYWLVDRMKLVVEAGGAVCVAALLTGRLAPPGRTVALLSGGNIMPEVLAAYLREASSQR